MGHGEDSGLETRNPRLASRVRFIPILPPARIFKSMTIRFQLHCLGEPALIRSDGQAVRIKVRKHLALLVYLVLEGGTRHRREKLAELLWPNLPEGDGRHSVATALTALRAAFGREVLDGVRSNYPSWLRISASYQASKPFA